MVTPTTTPSTVLTPASLREAVQWAYAGAQPRGVDREQAGYWRAILRPAYAPSVWEKVSAAVEANTLGPAARLRPVHHGKHVELRIFVADVDDRAGCARVRQVLRQELGFQRPIGCYRFDGRLRWRDPGATVPMSVGRTPVGPPGARTPTGKVT